VTIYVLHSPVMWRKIPAPVAKEHTIVNQWLCLSLLAAGLACSQAKAQDAQDRSSGAQVPRAAFPESPPSPSPHSNRADFLNEPVSEDVQQVAAWVADSGDNGSLPFIIVDKKNAKVFTFDSHAKLQGAAPALLGLAHGDDSTPGIGDMPLAKIGPKMRTTPAGRFVSALGRDLGKLNVLWVDYPDAISLHRVVTANAREHRLQRLTTPTPLDNRISFGCINVPVDFFNRFVQPAFTGTKGIVYILPEVKSLRDAFPAFYESQE
jgi:hypothetical protein